MDGHYAHCSSPGACWCEIRGYARVLLITLGILTLELAGAHFSNSLALYADAGHVFVDSGVITISIVALLASRYTKHPHNILRYAGAINSLLLVAIAFWIAHESLERFQNPQEVAGSTVMLVASLGAAGNWWQHKELHNVRRNHAVHDTTLLHILTDFGQSILVVINGLIITVTGLYVIDPITSCVLAAIMLAGAIHILLKILRSPHNT